MHFINMNNHKLSICKVMQASIRHCFTSIRTWIVSGMMQENGIPTMQLQSLCGVKFSLKWLNRNHICTRNGKYITDKLIEAWELRMPSQPLLKRFAALEIFMGQFEVLLTLVLQSPLHRTTNNWQPDRNHDCKRSDQWSVKGLVFCSPS